MMSSIFLFVFLFIAGLLTTSLPTKKIFAWFIAFSVKNPSQSGKLAIEKTRSSTSSAVGNSKKDEIMRSVFATFDKNSDGFITLQEMRLSLKNIGMVMEEKETEELIKNVDINGDGLIDLNEFRASFELLLSGKEMSKKESDEIEEKEGKGDKKEEKDLMQEAFDVFDEDKDGLITVEELGLILASMGFKEASKVEDCKKMIGSVDMDEDGMVNIDEFKKMMGNVQGFMPVA